MNLPTEYIGNGITAEWTGNFLELMVRFPHGRYVIALDLPTAHNLGVYIQNVEESQKKGGWEPGKQPDLKTTGSGVSADDETKYRGLSGHS